MTLIDADILRDKLIKYIGLTNGFERAFNEMKVVKLKQIKYFDEDEKVWKIGNIIVEDDQTERSEDETN